MLSYLEINKSNLIHNIGEFKKILKPDTKVLCVLKANAYGHGLKEIVQILNNEADWFGVNIIEELKELRKYSKKETLLLGFVSKENLDEAVKLKASICIYDLERAKLLNRIGRKRRQKVKIHIKIDTFLGRQGILIEELAVFAQELKTFDNLEIEGVYSHFSNIEDTTDFSHAQKQIDTYHRALQILKSEKITPVYKHISATSGILAYDHKNSEEATNSTDLYEEKNNIVRLGIGLYGLWPSQELKQRYTTGKHPLVLRPVIRWVTHIAQVKTVPAHFPIAYGLTYITSKETKIAVIPQGYSDGYDRGLSNVGEVLVHGTRCRILGRVMMNMFVVDVSHLETVKAEDEVVLLGRQGNEAITAEEVAAKLGTINYEVVARLSSIIPRKTV